MGKRKRSVEENIAWVLLIGSLIGWPVTQLTIAQDEPPVILGLSWAALAYAAMAALFAARGNNT